MNAKTYLSTPVGWFEITGSELGIRTVHFCEQAGDSSEDIADQHTVVADKHDISKAAEWIVSVKGVKLGKTQRATVIMRLVPQEPRGSGEIEV